LILAPPHTHYEKEFFFTDNRLNSKEVTLQTQGKVPKNNCREAKHSSMKIFHFVTKNFGDTSRPFALEI